MKPHISKCRYRPVMMQWACVGNGHVGFGLTASQAYDAWSDNKRRSREHSKEMSGLSLLKQEAYQRMADQWNEANAHATGQRGYDQARLEGRVRYGARPSSHTPETFALWPVPVGSASALSPQ